MYKRLKIAIDKDLMYSERASSSSHAQKHEELKEEKRVVADSYNANKQREIPSDSRNISKNILCGQGPFESGSQIEPFGHERYF